MPTLNVLGYMHQHDLQHPVSESRSPFVFLAFSALAVKIW